MGTNIGKNAKHVSFHFPKDLAAEAQRLADAEYTMLGIFVKRAVLKEIQYVRKQRGESAFIPNGLGQRAPGTKRPKTLNE